MNNQSDDWVQVRVAVDSDCALELRVTLVAALTVCGTNRVPRNRVNSIRVRKLNLLS